VEIALVKDFGQGGSQAEISAGSAEYSVLRWILVSRSINKMTFADGACEGRSRSEEEVMRDIAADERHRDRPQHPSAQRVAAGRHRFLCRSSSVIHTGIASSSLRELNAVALATNVTLFMERDT